VEKGTVRIVIHADHRNSDGCLVPNVTRGTAKLISNLLVSNSDTVPWISIATKVIVTLSHGFP